VVLGTAYRRSFAVARRGVPVARGPFASRFAGWHSGSLRSTYLTNRGRFSMRTLRSIGPGASRVLICLALVTVSLAACGPEGKTGAGDIDYEKSTVVASRATNVAADGQDRSVILVRLLDSLGNPIDGVSVTLESTGSGHVLT
jgi:hypothetical protein